MGQSVKPKVNRGMPKQKIEAKAKRLNAVKALQKEQKEREKKRKVTAVKTKKTIKKAFRSTGSAVKRADKFVSNIFSGFKW